MPIPIGVQTCTKKNPTLQKDLPLKWSAGILKRPPACRDFSTSSKIYKPSKLKANKGRSGRGQERNQRILSWYSRGKEALTCSVVPTDHFFSYAFSMRCTRTHHPKEAEEHCYHFSQLILSRPLSNINLNYRSRHSKLQTEERNSRRSPKCQTRTRGIWRPETGFEGNGHAIACDRLICNSPLNKQAVVGQ